MFGVFRGEHPRLTLVLPAFQGEIEVEFIVDTGFAGDLALPSNIESQLNGLAGGPQERRLAAGQIFYCDSYEIMLDWNSESRTTEVLVLEGEPLLGTVLMRENLLQVDNDGRRRSSQ